MANDDNVAKLSRDAEIRRRQLTDTIDQIRDHVVDTRQRLSPDHLKGEAKQYFADKGKSWVENIERTARENPLQAIAIGAGVAYPLLSIVKAVPKPLLAIGAGLALLRYKPGLAGALGHQPGAAGDAIGDRAAGVMDASKTTLSNAQANVSDHLNRVGDSVGTATSAIKDQARTTTANVKDAVGATTASVKDAVGTTTASVKDAVGTTTASVKDAVGTAADSAASMAANAGQVVQTALAQGKTALTQGMNATADMTRQTGQFASTLPTVALDAARENVLIVAGIGLAIGAVVAAAIPVTETEEKVLGPIGTNLKGQAQGLVDQGLGTLSSAAGDLYERTVDAANAQGLNADTAHRALSEISNRVEAVVTAATGSQSDENSKSQKPESTSPEFQS